MANMIRAALPPNILDELKHLAIDLKKPVQELLVEGAILLLHFHGRGRGLPLPLPPVSSENPQKRGGAR